VDFRAYLEYFGWSQREFARRIEVSEETVSRWKSNPPRLVMRYLEERKENLEFLKETGKRFKRFVT
jgi:transcriptional regulator with XRE-family HTH domain